MSQAKCKKCLDYYECNPVLTNGHTCDPEKAKMMESAARATKILRYIEYLNSEGYRVSKIWEDK